MSPPGGLFTRYLPLPSPLSSQLLSRPATCGASTYVGSANKKKGGVYIYRGFHPLFREVRVHLTRTADLLGIGPSVLETKPMLLAGFCDWPRFLTPSIHEDHL